MGSTAWNADGDVPVKYNIPWGAIRKAVLHYKDEIRKVVKITLGGIVFDIGKQATEGLVVVGNGYSSVTFFLPDDKEAMTESDGASMSIYDYLEMLGTTDYSVVTAWDYFARFVGDTVRSLIENSDAEIPAVQYSFMSSVSDQTGTVSLPGSADFSQVTTAQQFFDTIRTGLQNPTNAQASPLSYWMEEDGAVAALFSITASADNQMQFLLYIGRK